MNPPPPPRTTPPNPPAAPPTPPAPPHSMAGRSSILRRSASPGGPGNAADTANERRPLPEGTKLRGYTIVSRLGQGGFGITYLANTDDGKRVVIKEHMPIGLAGRAEGDCFITHSTQQDEEHFRATLGEFVDEATTLMGLENSGVVRILEAFEANGTAYYVMPFIEGESPEAASEASLNSDQRAKQARALRQWLASLLHTLEYLEQNNIVHRDIKPENILVTPDGHPILLDFGSARQRRQGKVFSNVFTPDFCAPEQSTAKSDAAMSESIGPWTDIYSLGATFYYLITRMLPPRAEMRSYAEPDPYKPLAARKDLVALYGNAFLSAIDRALELNPGERWQSAGDWKAALEEGVLPISPRALRRMRLTLASSLAGLVIFGGISFWALKKKEQAMDMYRTSLSFTENLLYDFYDDLSDIPDSTQLQRQLSSHLNDYLKNMEQLPIGGDEKLQRALVVALMDITKVNIELGDLEGATSSGQRASELELALCREYPENARYRFDLARTWLLRAEIARRRNLNDTVGHFVDEAMKLLTELRRESPGNVDYACIMGTALGYKSHFEAAAGRRQAQKECLDDMLKLYSALVQKYPRNEDVQRGYGYSLQLQADYAIEQEAFNDASRHLEEGRRIFTSLVNRNPYRLSMREGLALIIQKMGDMNSRMGEAHPDMRGQCDERAMDAYQSLLSLSQELKKLDSHNLTYSLYEGQALAAIVDIQLREGLINQAEASAKKLVGKMNKLLDTAPDNADYLYLKATALRGLGIAHSRNERSRGSAAAYFAESRTLLEKLVRQSPDNARLLWAYASTLAESAADAHWRKDDSLARQWRSQAIAQLEKLLDRVPDNKGYGEKLRELHGLEKDEQAPQETSGGD